MLEFRWSKMDLQEDDSHIVIRDLLRMVQNGDRWGGYWEGLHFQLLEAKASVAH